MIGRRSLIFAVLTTALLAGSCRVQEGCYEDEWQCADGLCILAEDYCNGSEDCFDGSDEEVCGDCAAGEWPCADGQCIPDTERCDNIEQCLDGTDEQACGDCSPSEFDCGDGWCIDSTLTCDGTGDCPAATDEAPLLCVGCDQIFICDDLTEIDAALVCDGTEDDCPDNSDEDYCWIPDCSSSGFECSNGVCWDDRVLCDGINQCGDCSDESGC